MKVPAFVLKERKGKMEAQDHERQQRDPFSELGKGSLESNAY
jgi:hypothetical protein